MDAQGRAAAAAGFVMAASGCAALGYQIVWTQQVATWVGHEAAAVLAVVAGFFGGLALGAAVLGGRIERSMRALRWYAGSELAIAAWGAVLLVAMQPAGAAAMRAIGVDASGPWQACVSMGITFVLLLPAGAAMGATLPALERLQARGELRFRSIAGCYAANTLGGVFGVLATAFWAVPTLGLARTAGVCIALNLVCAALSPIAFRTARAANGPPPVRAPVHEHPPPFGAPVLEQPSPVGAPILGHPPPVGLAILERPPRVGMAVLERPPRVGAVVGRRAPPAGAPLRRRMPCALAATGLLGIGYEVIVVRVLGQVSENTVYTYALLLAVYLAGTALGAALYRRWLERREPSQALEAGLYAGLLAACALGSASLWWTDRLHAAAAFDGSGLAGALAAEALPAVAAFGLPTVAMGAVFSHLAARACRCGLGFGPALAVNTLGAAAAPAVFGAWLTPRVDAGVSLAIVLVGYAALAVHATVARASRPGEGPIPPAARPWRRSGVVMTSAAAACAALVVAAAPPLVFVEVPDGGRIVELAAGALASVAVVEDARGVRTLRINNRQQEGSNVTGRVDGRQALLPLALHPAPRNALFLGLGTGVTATTAAAERGLAVRAVELIPEVVAASRRFVGDDAATALEVVVADARRYVRTGVQPYDVIVADNFHPARSGSASLYTTEHFAAVRDRLSGDGLFVQWLPLHQLDLASLRSIVRSFLAAYPEASAMLAHNGLETPVLGLVGRRAGGGFDVNAIGRRLRAAGRERLSAYGLGDELAVLGGFIADAAALWRFAGDVPVNTDDHPVVAYSAARLAYAGGSTPQDRLFELLAACSIGPAALLSPDTAPGWKDRLTGYRRARDRFLALGRRMPSSAGLREPQLARAALEAPLLAILRESPDFLPAYEPLERLAAALRSIDPAAANGLLARLTILRSARFAGAPPGTS